MENATAWIALGAAFVALVPVVVIASRQRGADESGAGRKKRGDGSGSAYTGSTADDGRKSPDSDGGSGSDGGGGDGGGGGD